MTLWNSTKPSFWSGGTSGHHEWGAVRASNIFPRICPHPFILNVHSVLEQLPSAYIRAPNLSCWTSLCEIVLCTMERSHQSQVWQRALLPMCDRRIGCDVPPWKGCPEQGSMQHRDRHVMPLDVAPWLGVSGTVFVAEDHSLWLSWALWWPMAHHWWHSAPWCWHCVWQPLDCSIQWCLVNPLANSIYIMKIHYYY